MVFHAGEIPAGEGRDGLGAPEQSILKDIGLETDARSNIKAEHEKYTTNVPRIFAADDC